MLTVTDKLSMIMYAVPRYTDWRSEGYSDDEAEELASDAIGEAESEITLLAAENERLKSKLDAVRTECEQSLQSSRGLSAKLSVLRLLEIIDKDGE